ncbi:non-ribosomal peptide synthetase [Pseudomonas sp. RT6P73]
MQKQCTDDNSYNPISNDMHNCKSILLANELFESRARSHPDTIAIEHNGVYVSYENLNKQSDDLMRYLLSIGVKKGIHIAILLDRSVAFIVAQLAILKCGAVYVPLDSNAPQKRQQWILHDSQAQFVLTLQKLDLPELGTIQRVDIDKFGDVDVAEHHSPQIRAGRPGSLPACIMYTSGSTGEPKGVIVTHAGIINLVLTNGYADFQKTDRIAFASNPAFDASTLEIWSALLNGARVVIVDYEISLDSSKLAGLLTNAQVTVLFLTTTLFNQHASLIALELSRLRILLCGGDHASPSAFRRILSHNSSLCLLNGYGPTETTTFASTYRAIDVPQDARRIPIGKPIANTHIHILDSDLQPVPVGVVGEIYIGGAGVAAGYFNRPQLTAACFIPDPFSGHIGATLYRSGDQGRYRKDGNIECLGRNDNQIKIRGFRVELGEIEAILTRHELVREAAVTASADSSGALHLVAYYTPQIKPAVDASTLRMYLRSILPDYMRPAAYVPLEHLPMTPNGKLDRKVLPVPDINAYSRRHYEAPQGKLECTLARIWCEILDLEQVGRHDHFFELGGHSLQAIRVLTRLRQCLSFELSLADFFAYPQLNALALAASKARRMRLPDILPAPRLSPLPLSFAQQRLWFLAHLDGGSQAYHVAESWHIMGDLNRQALQQAFTALILRHEALRTTFALGASGPIQCIAAEDVRFDLAYLNLSACPDVDSELKSVSTEESLAPFDLEQGPLIRGRLVHMDQQNHVLLLTLHHIVCDGWSLAVLRQELEALYSAFQQDRNPTLKVLPFHYADYAVWQRRWLSPDILQEQSAYWQRTLIHAPALLTLPTDRARLSERHYSGEAIGIELDATLTAGLKALSQRHGTTLYMTVLAAWASLLTRLSGQDEVVIGSPVANRTHPELDNLIGFFANTLAIRVKVPPALCSNELLEQVKSQTLSAHAHQDVPFEKVIESLNPTRSSSYHPVFQVMLAWQNTQAVELQLEGLDVRRLKVANHTAKFDLLLDLREAEGRISGTLEYATALFDQNTIQRHVDYLKRILQGMLDDEGGRLDQIALLEGTEHRQLFSANDTPEQNQQCPPQPSADEISGVHHLFERQVMAQPNSVAVSYEEHQLSYGELNAKANQVAHHLLAIGIAPGDRVAVYIDRGLEMVIALLGILKAGAAYVPLDPDYPIERLMYMLQDSCPVALLTQRRLQDTLPPPPMPVLLLDIEAGHIPSLAHHPTHNPQPQRPGLAPPYSAYVIYTSGSTGQPKGVVMPHAPLLNLLQWQATQTQNDVTGPTLQFAALGFDVAFQEIFSTLSVGAELILIPNETRLDSRALFQRICASRIERLFLPCIVLQMLAETVTNDAQGDLAALTCHLKDIFTSGESLRITPHIRAFFMKMKTCRLHNHYGPTESHVTTSLTLPDAIDTWPDLPAIGKPIPDTLIYILNNALQPVPVGVIGEIYIAGAALSHGYLHQPALTASRFLTDPFATEVDARMYKSGDLGRYAPDGNIECLGRVDEQIKIRGFRVEPGEVAAQLNTHEAVREAAVVVVNDASAGAKQLVAYYTTHLKSAVDAKALRMYLQSLLPDYMVPAAYVRLDQLPLTPNGKLNRQGLPAPGSEAFIHAEYHAPQGPLECAVAKIWSEILGQSIVGRHDSFFELGGHSVVAVRTVARINEVLRTNLQVKDLFVAPTLLQFTRRIELGAATEAYVNANVAVLDANIQLAPHSPLPKHQKVILLTGATGFIGRFLLRSLLDTTDARIYCLVRASQTESADQRLSQVMQHWQLWKETDSARISVIEGDLRQPLAGMDQKTAARLQTEVDAVYHNATSMNHLESFEMARATNADGTQTLLRFCVTGKAKQFNYISTQGIFSSRGRTGHHVIDEHSSIAEEKHLLSEGYVASKWAGELLVQQACSRGIPCNVFRLGLVAADTQHGRYDEAQSFYRMLKSCILMGVAFDNAKKFSFAPVDFIAQAIACLGERSMGSSHTFHPPSMNETSLAECFAFYNRLAPVPMDILPYDEWLKVLKLHEDRCDAMPITPLLELRTEAQIVSAQDALQHAEPTIVFDCSQTEKKLMDAGLPTPFFDIEMFETYVRGL